MKKLRFYFLALTLFFNMHFAQATIATYGIELQIDSISTNLSCPEIIISRGAFGCVAAGDIYRGSFGVESSILNTNGIVNDAPIYDFRLGFGNALYSTGTDNLTLFGFRNPRLGATAPGFVIENGNVVDFYGGIYGSGDIPFIDMYGYGIEQRNRFSAWDGATHAIGSLSIHRLPEPPNLALICLAFGGMVALRRKQIKQLARAKNMTP